MSKMCHACGSEQTNLSSEYRCKSCCSLLGLEHLKRDESSAFDVQKNHREESLKLNGWNLRASHLISCSPSCGNFPLEMGFEIRENEDESLRTNEAQTQETTDHSDMPTNGSSSNNVDIQNSHGTTSFDGLSVTVEEVCVPSSLALESHEESASECAGLQNSTLEDNGSLRAWDDSDGALHAVDSCSKSFLANIETNPLIWVPPEPLDIEDDMESVANNDDDDEFTDGTKWGQPSSLNGFYGGHGSSQIYKEQRQKAMMQAMNGQFKILVSRFLASEGIASSGNEGCESWLDIVASLSWEAALLVKPDASEGGAMDPGSYVKVKCIGTGVRSESQLIKGLVFKKNTAHKHMPTKYKNPKLLLLQGALGHRDTGLSSFESMEQEKDYLKAINDMIETCHPNVVLVEKTVSRDMQEFLLAKGMTLVFDMKLNRLERIARCSGSEMMSSTDILVNSKLKQCDSFHIEKFVEEHNSTGDGGKRSIKNLMFLEGFPKPLGCTILLKGAHSDELKKVKRVVLYTVFAAYHLILETSFFADQRAFFLDMHDAKGNDSSTDTCVDMPSSNASSLPGAAVAPGYSFGSHMSDRSVESFALERVYSPSNPDEKGLLESPQFGLDVNHNGVHLTQRSHSGDYSQSNEVIQSNLSAPPLLSRHLVSSFSSLLTKYPGDNIITVNSESTSSQFGSTETELDSSHAAVLPLSPSRETVYHKMANGSLTQEEPCGEKAEHLSSCDESMEQHQTDVSNKVDKQNKEDVESVLDPQSILVLFTSQCIAKHAVCEQSQLSRIKYYGNFDVSLGRFLQDILLNQKHKCSSCGEPPEAHVYSYTHQNGNLTVLVRQLPPESSLSGEAQGKIWMWTRCLKCEHESGIPKSTKRVVMSNAACGLSFGKFLELSFSSHSAASRLSFRCGHSLHRDSLRFFGLGSKVAMFRYSSVEIYAACKPPPVLEFRNPSEQECIKREAKDVLGRGNLFFSEVANMLQKLKPMSSGLLPKQSINFPCLVNDITEAEEMLKQEKIEFEASLLNAISCNGEMGKIAHDILSLGWLKQELLLELYIWDRRLHSLFLSTRDSDASSKENYEDHCIQEKFAMPNNEHTEKVVTENGGRTLEDPFQTPNDVEEFCSSNCQNSESSNNYVSKAESELASIIDEMSTLPSNTLVAGTGMLLEKNLVGSITEEHTRSVVYQNPSSRPSDLLSQFLSGMDYEGKSIPNSDHLRGDNSTLVTTEHLGSIKSTTNVQRTSDKTIGEDEASLVSVEQRPVIHLSQDSHNSGLEDIKGWIWAPFDELRMAYRKDLYGGYLQRFAFINDYSPIHLSPMHELVAMEGESLHYPFGSYCNVISVIEDEITSIIACALALYDDHNRLSGNMDERDEVEVKRDTNKAIKKSDSLQSESSVESSYWSSAGSSDSRLHPSRSISSLSSDELCSSSEGSLFVDGQISPETLHPEIPVGVEKSAGKSKFSVVCIHAKQFYALRRMCCPSELAYISSLSRCKKWDAQGGKSKAMFLKSMDDRLIIKQIKKTEFDSFLKFAPDYFKHISHSLSSGSQTCLAKILGIYQVRQYKGGKEVKTDLMVMENLLFGRNVMRMYDLKGAMFSRYVSDASDPEKVLWDQNFVEDMRESPMYVGGKTKHLLQRAIWNDTSFLTSINVMDYSLLVGVDKQRRELVFGIIDYLRQYTWDKQLETWVKSSLVVPKNESPTIVSPKEYKKRFRKFMSKYFLTVPDAWSSERCSGPCKFCCNGSNTSSKLSCANLLE